MMWLQKNSIQIITSIIIIIVSILIIDVSPTTQLKRVGFVNEGHKNITVTTTPKNEAKIEQNIKKYKNPSITQEFKSSAIDYSVLESSNDYVGKNIQEQIDGYEIKVDDDVYYTTQENLVEDTKNQIYKILIDDPNTYREYITNNVFTPYVENNELITDITIKNKITITPTKINKNEDIKTPEEFIYILTHNSDVVRDTAIVKQGDSIDSISEKYNLTVDEFAYNNPDLGKTSLLNVGDEVNVTPLESTLDIQTTKEVVETNVEKYNTYYQNTTELAVGKTEKETTGANGIKETTYNITDINEEVVAQNVLDETYTKVPQDEIIKRGVTAEYLSNHDEYENIKNADQQLEYIWPMKSTTISCEFGCYSGHQGTDITGPYGAPVYSSTNGQVIYNEYSPYGGGNEVRIYHDGVIVVYAHMKEPSDLVVGDQIEQGELIGYMGATGNVTGPHLHFEIRENASTSNWNSGTAVDIRKYVDVP